MGSYFQPRRPFFLTAILAPLVLFFLANACSFRISDQKALASFKKAHVPVQINDLHFDHRRLHYIQTGIDSAATLFFVHGSPGSWEDFMRYAMDSALVNRFRIISVDRPGFGHSNFGHPLPLAGQAAALELLMDSLQNGHDWHLIGHSLGGPLVAWVAADRPKEVGSLVILAGAMDPALEPRERWRYALNNTPLNYLLPGAFRPSNQELVYLKTDLYDLAHKMQDVRANVYVMHGNKDMFVDVRNVNYMDSMFTHARSEHDTILANENHFLPWTRFREIRSILLKLPAQ